MHALLIVTRNGIVVVGIIVCRYKAILRHAYSVMNGRWFIDFVVESHLFNYVLHQRT